MNRIVLLGLLAAVAACRTQPAPADTASANPAPSGSQGPAAGAPAPSGTVQPSPAPPMSSATITLVLDRTTYRPTDMVQITMKNDAQRNLGYNACTRTVERESATAWAAVPEPDRVCTMELRLLARGETVTEQTDLPAGVAPGRYRIVLSFSDQSPTPGAPVRGVSEPFTVR